MNEIIKKRIGESIGKEIKIFLNNGFRFAGKVTDCDDKYIEMLKYADVEEKQESSVIEMREEFTYGIELSAEDNTKIKEMIEECKKLIDITKEIVYS